VDALRTDLRDAWRALARDRGMTALALTTLALTIGATTSLFSIVHGVFLRPLPYPSADRLVRIVERGGETPAMRRFSVLTNGTYWAWRERARTIEGLAVYSITERTLSGRDEPARLPGSSVSPELFGALAARPALGRLLRPGDEVEGAERAVVLSHALWRTRFASDPDVIGATVALDNERHVIVGVAEPGFYFPDREAAYWVPQRVERPDATPNERRVFVFNAIARLAPGASPAQAAEEATAAARLARPTGTGSAAMPGSLEPPAVDVTPLVAEITRTVRPGLLALSGAVVLLLLVGTANVASLMMTRAVVRRRELAIRASVGATAPRLARQLLVEAVLLAGLGGLLGVVLAWWLHRALPVLLPADFPRAADIVMDWSVIAFAALVSLAAGTTFGIAPALEGARLDLVGVLHDGERAASGGARRLPAHRLRAALVIGQLTFSLALLAGATLLLRSFVALVQTDAGYERANVLTAQINFPRSGTTSTSRDAFVATLLERLRSHPAVLEAGATNLMPLVPGAAVVMFDWPGRTDATGQPLAVRAGWRVVSPGYIEAMGLRIRRGRSIASTDAGGVPNVLVNDTFVRTYLADVDPLGAKLPFNAKQPPWEVVGVVGDVRMIGLDAAPEPEIFISSAQLLQNMNAGFRQFLAVRATGDPTALAPALRNLVREMDPTLAVSQIMTMEQRISASVSQRRFYLAVLGAFAAIALVLSGAGLYGVVSRSVANRQREIGVRTALGARPAQVLRLVLRQGLTLALAGIATGLAAAWVLSRYVASLLYGVTPHDPLTFVAIPVVLLLVALLASILPARRAVRIDPVAALRAE
jgi:putative ABC transport system permease protein